VGRVRGHDPAIGLVEEWEGGISGTGVFDEAISLNFVSGGVHVSGTETFEGLRRSHLLRDPHVGVSGLWRVELARRRGSGHVRRLRHPVAANDVDQLRRRGSRWCFGFDDWARSPHGAQSDRT
jgi:hypothetical protein